ncbi:MAG: response regulator [Abditibacteriota bacterium]|nr:response regulator [Abditibacteriota bacterium]
MNKDSILIVDDNELQADLFSEAMEDSYDHILTAGDGVEALELIDRHLDRLAMVLLDINMPRMNGIEVLERLNEKGILEELPVLMISGEEDAASITSCFRYPIADYIPKKIDFTVMRKRVQNIADLFWLKNHLQETVDAQTEELRQKAERLAAINECTIELLGNVVEARNKESGEHVRRVRNLTRELAVEYRRLYPESGLTEEKIELIATGSVLHDLGKIMIPDNVLLKPGKLTDEEFELMKTHSEQGARLLEQAAGLWDEEYGNVCREICLYHHERADGRGYPCGLKEDEIPISAQLTSLADVYDALTSDRCYRKAFDRETAWQMITEGKCGCFSEKLMNCFKYLKNK